MYKLIICSILFSFNASATTRDIKQVNNASKIMQEPSHNTEKKDALRQAYLNRKKHFQMMKNKKTNTIKQVHK